MKSRIVSRTNLNSIAKTLGINELIETDLQATHARDSLGGNALEAILGALYLDRGFEKTKIATIQVLEKHSDLLSVQRVESDFKSRLYEEAHKHKAEIRFSTNSVGEKEGKKTFRSEVYFNQRLLGSGEGLSKKSAEQEAAKTALNRLNIVND
jgi:ribonuclease-3